MENNNKKIIRSLGIATLGGIGAASGVFLATNQYFKKMFDASVKDAGLDSIDDVPFDYNWLNDYKTEDLFITSFDNLELYGLSIKAKNKTNNWIIMVHGYKSLGMMMIDRAYEFIKEGYNVLLIDQRGCGKSEGRYITYGWLEHYDVLDWVNKIIDLYNDANIVLYGFSMGASTVMNVAGEYLVENIKCIIEDSGFSSIKDQFTYKINKKYKPNNKLIIPGLNKLMKKRLGFSIYEASCLKQLQQSVTPILFIHGEEDKNVPYEMVFDNYYACNSEKELFTVHEANHFQTTDNKYYYDRIFRFIKRFI